MRLSLQHLPRHFDISSTHVYQSSLLPLRAQKHMCITACTGLSYTTKKRKQRLWSCMFNCIAVHASQSSNAMGYDPAQWKWLHACTHVRQSSTMQANWGLHLHTLNSTQASVKCKQTSGSAPTHWTVSQKESCMSGLQRPSKTMACAPTDWTVSAPQVSRWAVLAHIQQYCTYRSSKVQAKRWVVLLPTFTHN